MGRQNPSQCGEVTYPIAKLYSTKLTVNIILHGNVQRGTVLTGNSI